MRRDVIVDRKERIPYNTPGNYPNATASNANTDRVRLVVKWHEENGGAEVIVPFTMTIDEARGVDIGDRLALTLDMSPIIQSNGQSEVPAPVQAETEEGATA